MCIRDSCYGGQLKLIAIPTLAIIAQAHRHLNSELIVPMIDARRMEVYYNIYDATLTAQQETNNLILESDAFKDLRARQVVFCGDGAFKMREIDPSSSWQILEGGAQAQHMASLAESRYKAQNFEDVAYYVPFYLKPPNITKSTKSLF